MDKLAPKLIRRAGKKDYTAIIIDPIYKVLTGDENAADQMAKFCNQFDLVCTELGCSVIYCHHHSKGGQGGKRSMDRASGSGVFARDPDALLDMIELELTEDILKQQEDKAVCAACEQYLEEMVPGWREDLSQDDLCSSYQMLAYCEDKLGKRQSQTLQGHLEKARARVRQMTALRIEGTLREFPKFTPVNIWFDYPIHKVDEVGILADVDLDDPGPAYKKNFNKRKTGEEKEKEDKETSLLAEFAIELSTCTYKEAMLTSGFHAIEDIVDGELPSFSFFELPACWLSRLLIFNFGFLLSILADFFPGHSQAVTQAIEADHEARRASGAVITSNAPLTVDE